MTTTQEHAPSMKTIVVGQQKGGVGKSTLAGNVSVCLAERGQRVILVDADKQQSSAKWGSRRQISGIDPEIAFATLKADKSIPDFINTIRTLGDSGKFDACIIDVGGHDSRELRAALSLANVLIAPCQPSQVDVEALGEFDELLDELQSYNPDLHVVSVINKANTGLFSHEIQQAADAIAEMDHLPRPVVAVADRPNYRTAWLDGKSVFDLPSTTAVDKARDEINTIVEAL